MNTWQDARGIVGTMIAASLGLGLGLGLGLAQPAVACEEPEWVRQLATTDIVEAAAVTAGDEGSVYVAGSISGAFNRNSTRDNDDAWIAKYSAAGAPIWRRRIGTAAFDGAAGVASDRKGAVYIVGSTQGPLGGQFQGGFDAWVAKYSADGDLQWKRQLGTSGLEIAWGAAADGNGNVYLAGWTTGSLDGPFRGGDSDAWVAKYSPAGALLWVQQLGTDDSEQATAVSVDDSGNKVFVAGSVASPTGTDGGDAWVAKYSAAGRQLWQRRLGTPVLDTAQGVAAASDGSVYVSGNTLGKLGGRHWGDFDAWVAKYSAAGTLVWRRQLGTPSTDGANAVATDAEGNVYVSGSTGGALVGNSSGADDAWIAKFARDGTLHWKRQLGSADNDNALGIATDGAGHVYVSGTTMGSLGGPVRGIIDAWVAKYSTNR